MNPQAARRHEDVRRLRVLCGRSRGRLAVEAVKGDPPREVQISVRCPTAMDREFPARTTEVTKVLVSLPERYPFAPPMVLVLTRIWHPNVWPNGTMCLGSRWLPTEGLDLLAIRVARIVSFDPAWLNPASPANREASEWYLRARAAHPRAFPTACWEYLSAEEQPGRMEWRNL